MFILGGKTVSVCATCSHSVFIKETAPFGMCCQKLSKTKSIKLGTKACNYHKQKKGDDMYGKDK